MSSGLTKPMGPSEVDEPSAKAPLRLLLYIAGAGLWLLGTAIAFKIKNTQLFASGDGMYIRSLAHREFAWHLPLFSASLDWFQGLGDIFFAVNFRLVPDFIVGSFFGTSIAAKVATYEVLLLELTLSIIFFALSLGTSRAVAIAAAVATCLVFLPFKSPSLIYPITALIPHLGTLIAGALVAGAAFLHFGRKGWRSDLPFAIIFLALLLWLVFVSITMIVLIGPFMLLCIISGTIAAASSAERRFKIILVGIAALLLLSGPAIYFAGILLDTAAVVFNYELPNDRGTFFFTSILFHWRDFGPTGPLLLIFGVCGALLTAFDRKAPRTLWVFSITLLTYLGSRLSFAVVIVLFDFWRGPAPLYFEFFVIPLYAIFAAQLFSRVIGTMWRFFDLPLADMASSAAALFGSGAALAVLLATHSTSPDHSFHFPPAETSITKYLATATGLQPNSVFQGRTVNMSPRSIDRKVSWQEVYDYDAGVWLATGNAMRTAGLHFFGVPALFEYTPTISPFFYALITRTLALPGENQMRNIIILRDIDPRILAMLGVRFVVTDREYSGPATLRMTLPTAQRTYFLYEIADPNLGNYSPTTFDHAATATDIIARIQNPAFDPHREVIGAVPDDTSQLVPASHATLTFLGDSLRLRAESSGRSVILLPLEFSHCLKASVRGSNEPLLFRANLLETGILFSGSLDITLALDTGPFLNPACRLRDFFEARALHVGDVPPRVTGHS
jgi:hypothetical protein